MDDPGFDELKQSVEEGGRILQGEQEPSRKAVMLRDAKGHWLPGQQPPNIIRSSEQAAGLAKRRWEVAKQKARHQLAIAYQEHSGQEGATPTDAYAGMAGEFARSAYANAMDKPREAAEAAKLTLRLTDMLPASEPQSATGARVTLELSPEAAAAALALLAERAGRASE